MSIAHDAVGEVGLGRVHVDREGRVLAVGARHQRAVALHLQQQRDDLLPQRVAGALVVEQADVLVGDRLHVAHGLVGGALHVDLPPARQHALDDDDAEAAPLVDHQHVAGDQLLELRVGVAAGRASRPAIVLNVGDWK